MVDMPSTLDKMTEQTHKIMSIAPTFSCQKKCEGCYLTTGVTKEMRDKELNEEEWMEVGAWVYNHFDEVSGISFLPHSDHSYAQAPYQDITKEEYLTLSKKMPRNVDWTLLSDYEQEDNTTGTQELACSAGACEIVDIT